jgi:polysaccharide export outer membrane protein
MRGVHAVFVCLLAALALSGSMRATGPVAMAQPQSDLDAMAYGRSYAMARAAAPLPARATYKLDAGDRLRVVVYGQEGLT